MSLFVNTVKIFMVSYKVKNEKKRQTNECRKMRVENKLFEQKTFLVKK